MKKNKTTTEMWYEKINNSDLVSFIETHGLSIESPKLVYENEFKTKKVSVMSEKFFFEKEIFCITKRSYAELEHVSHGWTGGPAWKTKRALKKIEVL